MSDTPNYSRPPVGEALIDIKIDPLSPENLPLLEALHAQLSEDYPTKKTRHRYTSTIAVEAGAFVTTPAASGPLGYWFESADNRRIVQARLDGFTYNNIKPVTTDQWAGWPAMRAEAKNAWDVYLNAVNPIAITQFAVRYINRIVIPLSPIELYDYFSVPPRVPPDLPYQDMLDFSSSVTIDIPEHKAIAVLRHAPAKEQSPGKVTVMLDIAVIRAHRTPVNDFPIWETLDQLRELKNKIFEASLLPKAKELFR